MLTQTFFNSDDQAKIETSYKKFRLIAVLLVLIGVPVDILIAFIASQRSPAVFWPVIIVSLAILALTLFTIFIKRLKLLKQDFSEQTKLIGELQVISKSEKEKQHLIGFESTDLKEINLAKDAFDKINVGDNLSIEVTKYAKHVLKLSKNGEVLMKNP